MPQLFPGNFLDIEWSSKQQGVYLSYIIILMKSHQNRMRTGVSSREDTQKETSGISQRAHMLLLYLSSLVKYQQKLTCLGTVEHLRQFDHPH